MLVDGDLRRSNLHKLFEMPREPGVADVLQGSAQLEQTLRPTPHPHLKILPAGTRVEHPGTLFERRSLVDLVRGLRERFDMIIFDAPPVLPVADATINWLKSWGVRRCRLWALLWAMLH